jgi:hypothetical protein
MPRPIMRGRDPLRASPVHKNLLLPPRDAESVSESLSLSGQRRRRMTGGGARAVRAVRGGDRGITVPLGGRLALMVTAAPDNRG